MHKLDSLAEAARLMTVCNSCRYCEGLCAVFPAMEMRRSFAECDLNLLANLCHGCGACHDDCQFAPPHEFAVNVPQSLAKVRRESWETYAWPSVLAGTFGRNGVIVAMALALGVAGFLLGFALLHDPGVLLGAHQGPGVFYRLIPHGVMALLFGGIFIYSVLALTLGIRAFWRDVDAAMPLRIVATDILQAIRDAGSLRYLDGGGAGCGDADKPFADRRRLFHHLTFYGFILCFGATAMATIYHYGLGREAPYAWHDLPVLLGTAGGIGLIVGPTGLLTARKSRRTELGDPANGGMDTAFTLMLLLTSITGLALLVLRETAAMGLLLAVHLGVVFALFATMPYGRFVHGLYRFAALVRYAAERRRETEAA